MSFFTNLDNFFQGAKYCANNFKILARQDLEWRIEISCKEVILRKKWHKNHIKIVILSLSKYYIKSLLNTLRLTQGDNEINILTLNPVMPIFYYS